MNPTSLSNWPRSAQSALQSARLTTKHGAAPSAQEDHPALQDPPERAQAPGRGSARHHLAAVGGAATEDAHLGSSPGVVSSLQRDSHAPHRSSAASGDPGRTPREEPHSHPRGRAQRAVHPRHVGPKDDAVQKANARHHRRRGSLPLIGELLSKPHM
ncbi:hypothetical protein ON010_g1235 [Phytophthora cinnamomi]|nr:hypothetical protein ON010_g1235 [Phytophthora cinnamomi]